MQKSEKIQTQKSKLSVISIVLLVIGSCIGSGIFYKNQGILSGNQGSIALSIVCWLIVGTSTIFIAFSLTEICSIKYDRPALGLLGWVKVFNNRFMYRCSKYYLCYCYWPILMYGLTVYFAQSICLAFNWNIPWYMIAIVSLIINTWFIFMTGIFTRIANISSWIITCFKFIPLVFAILIGYIYVGEIGQIYTGASTQGWMPQGNTDKTPLFSNLNIGFGMISTFPAIMFAMNGFQYAPSLQHDMKDPKKLSFSMNLGICIVLGIYIALSISLMICSDGSIKDLQSWLDYHNLHWLYVIVQLLISIGILSVVNGTAASGSRMYEDLIIHDELIGSHKFNKSRSNISKPVNGAIYFYIITFMLSIVCFLIGVFFVNNTGIKFIGMQKGLSKVVALNDYAGGIFTFADVLTSWTALFIFIVTAFSIYGCLRNRKTNKVFVHKNKWFVPSAIISLTVIGVTTLTYVTSCLINPFLVGVYLSKPEGQGYLSHQNGINQLVTTLLTLLMLFINIGASAIPAIIETNHKHQKYLNEHSKKKT